MSSSSARFATPETMEHAIAFAETGHLCLGTLHSNSANQTIDRIINFFSEERRKQLLMDLSSNLCAIVSQRLIRTADGKGRRAAIEILINTPIIADKLLKGEFHEIKPIMAKSRELGMMTFDAALFDLYNDGAISYDEAIRNADSAQRAAAEYQAEWQEWRVGVIAQECGGLRGRSIPTHRLVDEVTQHAHVLVNSQVRGQKIERLRNDARQRADVIRTNWVGRECQSARNRARSAVDESPKSRGTPWSAGCDCNSAAVYWAFCQVLRL